MSRHRFDHRVDHNDDKQVSAPARLRRVEVITGAERRRKWSAEEKAEIVAESLAEGAVVSEVARRHGARCAPRGGASEGRAMTAVEIARARLAQAAAKRASPKKRVARTPPRQDDSGTQSALEGAAESALHRAMTTTADALPNDVSGDALGPAAELRAFQLGDDVLQLRVGALDDRNARRPAGLALDELETAAAQANAEVEKADPERKAAAARKRRASRDESRGPVPTRWPASSRRRRPPG
jgi:transposase-like protein